MGKVGTTASATILSNLIEVTYIYGASADSGDLEVQPEYLP